MKVAFKSLIAAAAFIAAGTASAATVTVTPGTTVYKGFKLSGNQTLSFSSDALSLFEIFQPVVGPTSPATTTVTKDTDGVYLDVTMAAPLSSLAVDDTNDLAQSAASTGGLTMTIAPLRGVTSGGALTITDLQVDLLSKKVFATVIGGNGVGTLTNVYLWDFDTVAGNTAVIPPVPGSATTTFTVSGLHLTVDGYNKVTTSLGLLNIGKSAVASITDFGSISTVVKAEQVLTPLPTCSVSFKTTNKTSPLFNTEVTVANNGSNAATGWAVNWSYGKPTLLLNVKNAKLSNKSLKSYTAQPLASNATVAAGGSTTFSFRGYAGGGVPAVSDLSATLGGQTCPVTAQ